MKLICELWGEHSDIPRDEISCIGTVIDHSTQVAVAEIPDPSLLCRLSYTHRAMLFLGECEASEEAFVGMLTSLSLTESEPFCGRVKKMEGHGLKAPSTRLEQMIGRYIGGTVSVSVPGVTYRALASGNRIFFGKVIWEIERGPYHERKPGNRKFFHPGVMMPRMIRALVNLSQAMPGEVVLDPFCGTGGTLIEAELLGCYPVGGDADPMMIHGTRLNLPHSRALVADVRSLPFPDQSVDHIVSDLPYGQSVLIIGSGLDDLYHCALFEMRRILKPEKLSVIVTHQDIRPIVSEYFHIERYYEQRVHRSLTRRVMVLRKG